VWIIESFLEPVEEFIDLRIQLAQRCDALHGMANRRVVTTVLEVPDRRRTPSTHTLWPKYMAICRLKTAG